MNGMQKIAQRLFHSTMVRLPYSLLFSSISHLDRINFVFKYLQRRKMEMIESIETMTFARWAADVSFVFFNESRKIERIKKNEKKGMPNACARSCCEPSQSHTFTKFMFDVITFSYNENERNEKERS